MGSRVHCREGAARLKMNRFEILRLDKEPESRVIRIPGPTVVYLWNKWGEGSLVHGEVRGFFLIRVKLNIFILYPSALSIWDPSRASEGKVMVQDSSFCGAHGCRGQGS